MAPLADRLVEFARDQNQELVAEFEEVRAELARSKFRAASDRCQAWRAHLDRHVSWEERQVYVAYDRRCRSEDRFTIDELVRDHRLLVRMATELAILLDAEHTPDATVLSELVDDISAILSEHRISEETEVCAALDHALDSPTRERIEEAYDPAKPPSSD